jgi:methionine-rich copper-binding protein CopC
VPSPSELRLWFSQVPQESSTSARIIQGDAPVDVMGGLAQDPDDPKVFAAPFTTPLAPGSYLVAWRTMAADGHVVRGEFGFSVTAD